MHVVSITLYTSEWNSLISLHVLPFYGILMPWFSMQIYRPYFNAEICAFACTVTANNGLSLSATVKTHTHLRRKACYGLIPQLMKGQLLRVGWYKKLKCETFSQLEIQFLNKTSYVGRVVCGLYRQRTRLVFMGFIDLPKSCQFSDFATCLKHILKVPS
jgi:hypothetical protein